MTIGSPKISLADLNRADRETFVETCGPLFEHSPWIAERAWSKRPFASLDGLHARLVETVNEATVDEQIALVRAHPDLVGRIARDGRLTNESTGEQAAAGLTGLSETEIELFDRYNSAYRDRFGFPFVICARENKKQSILAAFPVRLKNDRTEEIRTALREIGKIARLRMLDRIGED